MMFVSPGRFGLSPWFGARTGGLWEISRVVGLETAIGGDVIFLDSFGRSEVATELVLTTALVLRLGS